MYVYIHRCTYVYPLCMYIHTSMYIHMYIDVCIYDGFSCVYIIHVYILCTYMYIHIYLYTYVYVHMNPCIHVYTYAYMCVYTCMCVCIHTCVCLYTHTFTPIQGCTIGRITTVFYARELCSHKLMDLSKIMQLLSGRSKI